MVSSLSAAMGEGLTSQPAYMNELLEPIQKKFQLPALAAAMILEGKLHSAGAVGIRKTGETNQVTLEDKFHIGSCTKSMTATLAAMLVEQKKLSWETRVAEIFPEWTNRMAKPFGNISLAWLLGHKSGIDPERDNDLIKGRAGAFSGTPEAQRRAYCEWLVQQPLQSAPGLKFAYNNSGYALAGAMLERRGGKSWEEQIRRNIFEPLKMESGGFGPPNSPGKIDQPWGHQWVSGRLKAFSLDNPVTIAPAGAVHCNIFDLARYAQFHLEGARGEGQLLTRESFRQLGLPFAGEEYAMGWLVVERSWAGGKALTHAGSNTLFYSVIWIAPARNFAVVVATNLGGRNAEEGCDAVAGALIERWLKK
ncbi:MAG: serine hydrolase domain-containing protein [Verrucomicrobiota bacterium]|nr:serine hydrolase domain-containing protein [Verrucomicrobiota bacterium]